MPKPKPLKNKRIKLLGLVNKDRFAFYEEDVKQACDFFLRYKGNPSLLIMERPELKGEVENMFLDRYSTAKYGVNVWRLEQYNEWLFKLAFKDVFEGENDGLGKTE